MVELRGKLLDHLDRYAIGDDDLLFPLSRLADELVREAAPGTVRAIPEALGRPPPDPAWADLPSRHDDRLRAGEVPL